jgi:hypothetical protein
MLLLLEPAIQANEKSRKLSRDNGRRLADDLRQLFSVTVEAASCLVFCSSSGADGQSRKQPDAAGPRRAYRGLCDCLRIERRKEASRESTRRNRTPDSNRLNCFHGGKASLKLSGENGFRSGWPRRKERAGMSTESSEIPAHAAQRGFTLPEKARAGTSGALTFSGESSRGLRSVCGFSAFVEQWDRPTPSFARHTVSRVVSRANSMCSNENGHERIVESSTNGQMLDSFPVDSSASVENKASVPAPRELMVSLLGLFLGIVGGLLYELFRHVPIDDGHRRASQREQR